MVSSLSDIMEQNRFLVRLEGVDVVFGQNQVLRDIAIDIPRGQTLAVIGESGCGKTVLLKTIIGLLRPDRGTVRFDGRDLAELGDTTFYKEVARMLGEYRQRCKKVIHRRNKQLAHFDLATLMTAKSAPIPGPSRQEIEDALLALRIFMNALQRKFARTETAYRDILLTTDGDQLLLVLEHGLRYQHLEAAKAIDLG